MGSLYVSEKLPPAPPLETYNDPHDLTYLGQMEWLFANSRERKRQEKTERKSSKKIIE